jgi:hypothetical protein
MSICSGNSVFGNKSQFIKFQNSDLVAIEGVNTVERLLGGDIRIPYKQLLKSRIILKAGQVNYLLNHLGMGDNATFLVIKATYNTASVNEEDNYILWNYYDNFSSQFPLNRIMILTGNSTNRIKQLYLTNPSTKYAVILDVMVASIDDTYNFFPDTTNQSATTFTGLSWTDIVSYVIGQSIYIQDLDQNPLIYINISNINSVTRSSNVVTLDDDTLGTILLVFTDESNATQAHSSLSYLLGNSTATLPLTEDAQPPVVYFYQWIDNNSSNEYISFNGATGSAFDTTYGFTFSTSLSLSTFGPTISKNNLITYLIDYCQDTRDGMITVTESNILIYNNSNSSITSITASGTYSIKFNLTDLALNNLDDVLMTLGII